jgi:exosortase
MSAFQRFSFSALRTLLLPLCALAWLWFRLIDHLRVEWSVNPQYAYGWAVPFLCAYLLWRRVAQAPPPASSASIPAGDSPGSPAPSSKLDVGCSMLDVRPAGSLSVGGEGQGEVAPLSPSPVQSSKLDVGCSMLDVRPAGSLSAGGEGQGEVSIPHLSPSLSLSAFQLFSFFLLAFLYLPTRLIQEANPEWRLVSWALGLEVIGITLLMLPSVLAAYHESRITNHESRITLPPFQFSAFNFSVFPICFFLVAVPWPTFIEGPLIQGLMRANIAVTIELLGALGVPAVQHGNVIEIATGMVGIDDACSGIRSLQAALMLSLFFGELYGLSARRRAFCVLAGFALAFVFNVGRTLLLTQVASAKGVGAVASWHDPAGVTILVACFLCLWLIARALQRGKAEILKSETLKLSGQKTQISGPLSACQHVSMSAFAPRFSICLIAWLLLVETGTEFWYRSHEWRLPTATVWKVEPSGADTTTEEVPFSQKERRALRFDEAANFKWQASEDTRWQVIFMRWNPGRSAGYLAKGHTPNVCLTASGRELVAQSALHLVRVHGIELPFCSYVFKGESGPLHVFFCLVADHPASQSLRDDFAYASRLAPVLAGRRNSGQSSLEVAIWGIPDQNEAEAALSSELEKLIRITK